MSTVTGPLVILALIVEFLVFIEMYEVACIFIGGFGVGYVFLFARQKQELRRQERVSQIAQRLEEVTRR